MFKTIYFWLVVRTWDLGPCMGFATQGMHWNHHLLQMMWHRGKQKKQLIQRIIISESTWHNGIMSYKPLFSWISMNVLMCVGFLVFFDSPSASYPEMSYLYHVYIISHNVSRNKAKSKGMSRYTVPGILYSQKCFILALHQSKHHSPLTTLFWGIFQRRAFFFLETSGLMAG